MYFPPKSKPRKKYQLEQLSLHDLLKAQEEDPAISKVRHSVLKGNVMSLSGIQISEVSTTKRRIQAGCTKRNIVQRGKESATKEVSTTGLTTEVSVLGLAVPS